MIRALLTGTLYEIPVTRMGKTGKPFTTAKLKADTVNGSIWCSLVAFGEQGEALAEQCANAAISIAGRATPTAWIDKTGEAKAGLDVVVDQIATLRTKPRPKVVEPASVATGFDDDLPFS